MSCLLWSWVSFLRTDWVASGFFGVHDEVQPIRPSNNSNFLLVELLTSAVELSSSTLPSCLPDFHIEPSTLTTRPLMLNTEIPTDCNNPHLYLLFTTLTFTANISRLSEILTATITDICIWLLLRIPLGFSSPPPPHPPPHISPPCISHHVVTQSSYKIYLYACIYSLEKWNIIFCKLFISIFQQSSWLTFIKRFDSYSSWKPREFGKIWLAPL